MNGHHGKRYFWQCVIVPLVEPAVNDGVWTWLSSVFNVFEGSSLSRELWKTIFP